MLMEHVGRRLRQPIQRKFTNALNNACSRGRQDWSMVSWRDKSTSAKNNGARDWVIAKLDDTQRALNTTRGSTPGLDRFGNRVPMPTERRHRNSTHAQPRKLRSKPSDHPSTRLRKAAQSSKSQDGDEEEETAVEGSGDDDDDDDDSDVDLYTMPLPVSRPKRKRATNAEYAVEEQFDVSANSGFELNTDSKRTQTKQQDSDEDGETFEQRPKISTRGKAKQFQYTESHVQEKEPPRTRRRNDVGAISLKPLSQQPPSSISTNVSHSSKHKPKPRYVEETQRNHMYRPPPHSTSYTQDISPSNPYASQAAYGVTPGLSGTCHDLYAPKQATIPSTITHGLVNNGDPRTYLPDTASGHRVYRQQPIYAPQRIAGAEQAMLMHSRNGHISLAPDEPYRATNGAGQSLVAQSQFGSPIGNGNGWDQRWPSTHSSPRTSYPGYHGTEVGSQATRYTSFRRENSHIPTLPNRLNVQEPAEFFNNNLATDDGPMERYRLESSNQRLTQEPSQSSSRFGRLPPTQVTTQSSLRTYPHPRYGSSPWAYTPQPDYVPLSDGRTRASTPAIAVPAAAIRTFVQNEATAVSAGNGHDLAPQAIEANMALWPRDLFGGLLDPAPWNLEGKSFFNTGPDLS